MHDLLDDPLIGIRTAAGAVRVSLPELLTRLSRGEDLHYTGLRPHQADPWHVFLVQVAASVMARQTSSASLPADEAFWRAGLLDLADGRASAWQLVVDDVMQPAFMQHPLAAADELKNFKPKADTPDQLDVLVTAKDHDVKSARMGSADPEPWLFALLTDQTTSGYLGAGNFGSVRMNGGFGSRAFVSLVNDPTAVARFVEEVAVLMEIRRSGGVKGLDFAERGSVLTWSDLWQRKAAQWLPAQLEPWFVEAVRPVRLVARGGGVQALAATSEARQIGPKTIENGDVGDPWLPINVNDKKKGRSALTVSASAWSPELLCRLLFQDGIELTPLQRPRAGMTGTSWLVGSVLVRGQGTTDGFHRFALPVPAQVRGWLVKSDARDRLARFAKELLADAKEVENTLRGALMVLADGGPESVNFGDETLKAWSRAALDSHALGWNDRFFPSLWQAVEHEPMSVRDRWCSDLAARAREALDDAHRRLPLPSSRRYRAQVRARGYLSGSLRKKGLIPERLEQTNEERFA
jgi:CRISPR system Cascade subunit CasA